MKSGRYGQHNLKIIGLILGSMVIISTFVILLSGDRYEDYLGLGEYPNCMKVDEYGDAGMCTSYKNVNARLSRCILIKF